MMVLKQIFHSHTLIFTLFFIKSNKFSLFDVLWGLPVKSLLFKKIIELIPLTKKLYILDYEVNTGRPIVAVVINAPAKIKKGR